MASPSNAKFSLKAEELLQPEPGIKSGNAVAVSAQKEAGSGYLNTMVVPLSPNSITECLSIVQYNIQKQSVSVHHAIQQCRL